MPRYGLDYFLETVFGHTGSVRPGTIAGPFQMGGRQIDGLGPVRLRRPKAPQMRQIDVCDSPASFASR